MEDKAALRRAALSIRRAVADGDRETAAGTLLGYIDDLPIVPGSMVSGFWPIRGEIDPLPLMRALKHRGCRLCLPAIIDKTTIVFREWINDEKLVDTGFGTMGPNADAAVVDPDVLLVPIAVFDRRGGRIGYGAGYYDRAIEKLLAKRLRPKLIGLAFACQETESVPLESHDKLLDMIATDAEIIHCC